MRKPTLRSLHFLVLGFLALGACGAPAPPLARPLPAPRATVEPARATSEGAAETPVAFEIRDGRIQNQFYRRGRVAAHALATSGTAPRLVFAFPAGNMGAGLWFDVTSAPVTLTMRDGLRPVERADNLRGVATEIHASAPALRLRRVALGSVRTIRGVDAGAPVRERAQIVPGQPVVLRRTTLDGGHHLEVDLEPLAGTTITVEADGTLALAAANHDIAVRVTALSDETPLTPVPVDELLVPGTAADPRLLDVLAFLSYREKLLAGSWHYLTYFGRDTLLTARLLLPSLRPALMEAALGSVIERLSADGEVAHEEEIGEFAVEQNLATRQNADNLLSPRYDRKMVDDDFLLAPVLAEYLLGGGEGRARAAAFLARRTSDGRTFAAALRSNLVRVVRQATPFAEKRSALALVALEPGNAAGNWRDSDTGLGGGRFPYDVNVALVPAALSAIVRLADSGLLADEELASRARKLAPAWQHTERFFRVEVPAEEAKKRVLAYAAETGIEGREAAAAVKGPIAFRALSLDGKGTPVPVMSSDDGFVLLFGDPEPPVIEEAVQRIVQPFPLGLRTPVGVVVANPVFSRDAALRRSFDRSAYHGTVVWSWQQALLAAGLRRQLARPDLPPATRSALESADRALWSVVRATQDQATAELWSFRIERGQYVRVPFGQEAGDAEESNAAQLWSTVFLAVRPR